MKYYIALILCFVFSLETFIAQPKQRAVPREMVTLVVNNETFLTGEYLYYRVQQKNTSFAKTFNGSAIAYVSLVSDTQTKVFEHKIALQKGVGHGDYFLPNGLTSGSYKLLAYTHETLNATSKQFFEKDILIVNPYQADQRSVLHTTNQKDQLSMVTIKNHEYDGFEIQLDDEIVGKRAKVNVILQNKRAENGFGSYAISVKKIDELTNAFKVKQQEQQYAKNSYHPLETKGHLLTGTLIAKETGFPLANKPIAMSVPGNDFFFQTRTTNSKGTFQFEIPTGIEGEEAYIRPLSEISEPYRVEVTSKEKIDFSQLRFPKFTISENMKDAIVSRSVANQIENAYFSKKPDTVATRPNKKSFLYYEVGKTYTLEEYTRFRTLEETFTEFIPSVNVLRNRKGTKEIRVFEKKFAAPTNDLPLFFVDGLWVRDVDEILALDARALATIKVIRRGYSFEGTDYFGVILITSNDMLKTQQELLKNMTIVSLFKPEPLKTYYQQRYDTNAIDFTKIPDYRHQLFWHPNYIVNTTNSNLSFFTSDLAGVYLITVEGVNARGEHVQVSKQFIVTDEEK